MPDEPKSPSLNKKIVELIKNASVEEIEEILVSRESALIARHQNNNQNNRQADHT